MSEKLTMQLVLASGMVVALIVAMFLAYVIVLSGNPGRLNWRWMPMGLIAVFVAAMSA